MEQTKTKTIVVAEVAQGIVLIQTHATIYRKIYVVFVYSYNQYDINS